MIQIRWANGIHIDAEGHTLMLDPVRGIGDSEYAFISHAHMDHTGAFIDTQKIKYTTKETIALFEAVSQKKVRNAVSCSYGQTVHLHQLELEIINSGHVFGSGALYLKDKDVTFLYTGDFNFTDSLTQKAIQTRDCDILVIETTYGRPDFAFPRRDDVYDSIAGWAAKTIMEGGLPVFLLYPVGKAQEVTRLFNLLTSIPVVTHPAITRTNSTVNAMGGDLVFYDLAKEGEELIRSKSCVCLFPNSFNARGLKTVYPDARIATVTGWALNFGRRNADSSFVLSSHADYPQLIQFVKGCHPKKVYTMHGYAAIFANKLKREGIDAVPLC
jgi:Cft2 family RNA processing exonuclease